MAGQFASPQNDPRAIFFFNFQSVKSPVYKSILSARKNGTGQNRQRPRGKWVCPKLFLLDGQRCHLATIERT